MSRMLVGSRISFGRRDASNAEGKFPAEGRVSDWHNNRCRLLNLLGSALKAINTSTIQGPAEKPDDF
jgi:hypothetical protein